MSLQQQIAANDVEWSRRERGDTIEFAVDFGPRGQTSVDVVGDTVIVVAGDEQYEFEVERDARVSLSNGVLTVEVER